MIKSAPFLRRRAHFLFISLCHNKHRNKQSAKRADQYNPFRPGGQMVWKRQEYGDHRAAAKNHTVFPPVGAGRLFHGKTQGFLHQRLGLPGVYGGVFAAAALQQLRYADAQDLRQRNQKRRVRDTGADPDSFILPPSGQIRQPNGSRVAEKGKKRNGPEGTGRYFACCIHAGVVINYLELK